MPDEFHPSLRRTQAQEQMEASQRDDEPHGSQAGRLVGEDHSQLPPRWVADHTPPVLNLPESFVRNLASPAVSRVIILESRRIYIALVAAVWEIIVCKLRNGGEREDREIEPRRGRLLKYCKRAAAHDAKEIDSGKSHGQLTQRIITRCNFLHSVYGV